MSGEDRQEQYERQLHMNNLQAGGDSNAPETLKYVSKPEDVESPVEALEWINSKSTSTANLKSEDVDSKEWVIEIHQLLSRMNTPPKYGIAGHRRAVMYDDTTAYQMPLSQDERLEIEGFSEIGKESSTRSKEGWAFETATKDTTESLVKDDGSKGNKSGGLLGRFR